MAKGTDKDNVILEGDPGLTRGEYSTLIKLVENKTVKVGDPVRFERLGALQKKLLDFASGPGLGFDQE